MNLKQLVLEQHLKEGNKLLESVCADLTVEQSRIVKGIYKECLPLIEASLTADQVNQIFTGVQQNSRTALGKAIDVPSKVNSIINQIGGWLQNTTPVKFADQQYENLKNKIAAKFPNLDQQLTDMGTWMKDNPGKSAAIIGVLTALASLAGGPVGGAIAGQVLRGAAELIKGEKLSTAVGKGIKTAALGYLSGKAFQLLGDWMGSFREQSIPFGPANAGLERVSWGARSSITSPGMEWTRTTQGFNALVRPEEAEVIRTAMAGIKAGEPGAFDTLYKVAREVHSKEYKQALNGVVAGAWEAAKANDSILQFINVAKQGLQAAAQGAVAASTGGKSTPKTESLTLNKIKKIFYSIDKQTLILDEGIFDKIKQAGQRLTSKISADQLMKAWQAAGSPMDSDQIANFLQTQGVSPEVISKVYQDSGLGAPVLDAKIDMQALIKQIQSLTSVDQQQILASLA